MRLVIENVCAFLWLAVLSNAKPCRVARYQQLQAQWSRDRFLQSTSKPRKNVGFQRAFAAAHEASRADLEELKAENAWESARALASGYVPPEGKRRDSLRWQTRVAMQQQEL